MPTVTAAALCRTDANGDNRRMSVPVSQTLGLLARFTARDFANRFTGSLSGVVWAVLQPLMLLAVYSFVFVHIFKARLPGADAPGFVPFLVMAMWPWFAFSEALSRATLAIQENAALIGKVALPREVLVLSSVCASFLLHMTGFILIVVALALAGKGVNLAMLPVAMLLFIPLFALATGFALAFAAIQVFVRDLSQALPQVLMVGMFGAPIFYDRAMFPEAYRGLLDLNPYTFYAEGFRALLLGHGTIAPIRLAIALLTAALVAVAGAWLFRRLDPHFEDFM